MPSPGDTTELLRRCVQAAPLPDQSFCWWIEVQSTEREPDVAALTDEVDRLFDTLWTQRVNRGAWCAVDRTGESWDLPAGLEGLLYRAGPFPIFPGSAQVTHGSSLDNLLVRLVDDNGNTLAEGVEPLNFQTVETVFGCWVELHAPRSLAEAMRLHGIDVRVVEV